MDTTNNILPEHSPETGPELVQQARGSLFCTTHWSAVLQAGGRGGSSAEALETLCRNYWYPLYAFVRRRGHGIDEAQDLTQEFFARLLAGNYLAQADPSRGRFRSFLLASLKHFLANEWHRSQCQKRGGGCVIFSVEEAAEEERKHFELPDHASPDRLFERRWIETLLERVTVRLRREYEEAGWRDRFDALKIYLLDDYEPLSYSETAKRLGLTESAVKSAIYKLRQRYAQVLRAEIAHTVDDPAEVEAEIRFLLQTLAG